MNSVQIRKLVTAAIIVALAMAFQLLLLAGGAWTSYIVGSLVNLCLIMAAVVLGPVYGIAVGILTPLIALLYGHAQPPMLPWIIAGNIVLVLLYAFFANKDKASLKVEWVRWCVVGVATTLVKYLIIALGQATVLSSVKGLAFNAAFSTAAGLQVVQIITGLIGMVLGGLILTALPKSVKELRLAK